MQNQTTVTLALESKDFPCDGLKVNAIAAREAIGRLYELDLEVVSARDVVVDPAAMIGAAVTVTIECRDPENDANGARVFHGLIAEVDDLMAARADARVYRLRVLPRASFLGLVETQEIFIGLSVPGIIAQKLAAVGLADSSDLRLRGSYPTREFVVEYRESDLAFVSRLSEHLGISFYFEDSEAGPKLVFADDLSGFTALDEPVAFRARGEARGVFELTSKRRVIPSYYAACDYNYRTPLLDLTGDHDLGLGFGGGVIEFGSHHKTPDEGVLIAKVRAEERAARSLVYSGKSTIVGMAAGRRIKIDDHPDLGSIELLVTEVEHELRGASAFGASSDDKGHYQNSFHAVPTERPFRPARITPRPRIHGLVTGIIDGGPAARDTKYAFLDDQGRYLVSFLFETPQEGTRPPSHPVRMLQNHVGEGYGTHFPLKPGAEVSIGFIDGDPDRPLIVGAVPNPIKPSPVTNAERGLHRIKTATGITVDMKE